MQFGCNYNKNKYPLVSDNKYFDKANHMEDGRVLSDWRPSAYTNNVLRMKYGLYGSNEFRQFLQSNSEMIMKDNTDYYKNMTACHKWVIIPEMTTCNVNESYMRCKMTNPQGVGVRYKAYNS